MDDSKESNDISSISIEFSEEREDFFETNTFLNDEKRCCFCSRTISLMPFVANGNSFCDVICARLYYDSKTPIFYDKHQYDTYYKNGLLSTLASSTYKLLRSINLAMLPTVEETNERKDIVKNRYAALIMSYVSQVMG